MGQIYLVSKHTDEIKKMLEEGKIPGAMLYETDKSVVNGDLWPFGIKVGDSVGFFEDKMILFWGLSNPRAIHKALMQVGISMEYMG